MSRTEGMTATEAMDLIIEHGNATAHYVHSRGNKTSSARCDRAERALFLAIVGRKMTADEQEEIRRRS